MTYVWTPSGRLDDREQVQALRRFGDLIALLARGRLVAHVALGRSVRSRRTLLDYHHVLRQHRVWRLAEANFGYDQIVWESAPADSPEDTAAEAVARLMAEEDRG